MLKDIGVFWSSHVGPSKVVEWIIMRKWLLAGLLSGCAVSYLCLVLRRSVSDHVDQERQRKRSKMTAEDKIIALARAVIAEQPGAATPDETFLRDWAYGNAGLEDERITLEQVEAVVRSRKSA